MNKKIIALALASAFVSTLAYADGHKHTGMRITVIVTDRNGLS